MAAQPIFFVGSGRCGTSLMAQKLMPNFPSVEAHHEYCCTHVQRLGVLYYNCKLDICDTMGELQNIHGSALKLSKDHYWVDASNKLTWLIGPMEIMCRRMGLSPLWVWLTRDGRNVVSSYYHKLKGEIYERDDYLALTDWLRSPDHYPIPPPEKKYWWPYRNSWVDDELERFRHICWLWDESNRQIEHAMRTWVDGTRYRRYKLEEIVSDYEGTFTNMVEFLGFTRSQAIFDSIQRPHNVAEPKDYPLDEVQTKTFWKQCEETMYKLGYRKDEPYRVDYGR